MAKKSTLEELGLTIPEKVNEATVGIEKDEEETQSRVKSKVTSKSIADTLLQVYDFIIIDNQLHCLDKESQYYKIIFEGTAHREFRKLLMDIDMYTGQVNKYVLSEVYEWLLLMAYHPSNEELLKGCNYLNFKDCAYNWVDNIHTVLHQVLNLAVEDDYIRYNPADNALKELRQVHNCDTEKKKSLTIAEQQLFLDFLKRNHTYSHWYPIFAVMLGTGMRVGEITGLRWQDIDFEKNAISVNHTLVYYNKGDNNGCSFAINTPKSKAGWRTIPMTEDVRNAIFEEKEYQNFLGISCNVSVDTYTDFVFVNRFGNVQHQGTLNKALRRIIRDCNKEIISKNKGTKDLILLPKFSCHILRHTFTTRLCEAGVNVKIIQDVLGHSDISTTMNIYADATKEMKDREFGTFEEYLKSVKNTG